MTTARSRRRSAAIASLGLRLVLGACLAACAVPGSVLARAQITGGCTAAAIATTSGAVDVTTQRVWHVRRDDVVRGGGRADAPQVRATVVLDFFGLPVTFAPLVSSAGGGASSGVGGPFTVADYARFSRVFAVSGTTDGANGGHCSGSILLVVDDQNALTTVAGGAALAASMIGILSVIVASRWRRRAAAGVLGAVAGFIGGAGLSELGQQLTLIDATSLRALALPVGGVVAGVLLAGMSATPWYRRPRHDSLPHSG